MAKLQNAELQMPEKGCKKELGLQFWFCSNIPQFTSCQFSTIHTLTITNTHVSHKQKPSLSAF